MDGYFLNKRAFSLTEIAVSLGVMIVVLSTLFSLGGQIVTKVKDVRVNNDLNSIAIASQQFYSNTGHWPIQVSDLQPYFLSPSVNGGDYILNPQTNLLIIVSGQNSISVVRPR